MNIFLISELINKDGSPISGDKKLNQVNNKTTSKSTTDDFVGTSRQGISYYNNHGRVYVGEEDETTEVPEKKVKTNKKKKPTKRKELKETGRKKMYSLIEDVFTKKDFDREFVQKNKLDDFRLNGIQDLETIKETNPILMRKVSTLRDLIEKTSTSGEEKAIILNFLLSMDIMDIPNEYKQELKKKLG